MASKKKSPPVNWKSRKIWFSVFAVLALLLGVYISEDSVAMATIYSTYAGSVVTITGLLIAGNVTSKWAFLKKAVAPEKDEEKIKNE